MVSPSLTGCLDGLKYTPYTNYIKAIPTNWMFTPRSARLVQQSMAGCVGWLGPQRAFCARGGIDECGYIQLRGGGRSARTSDSLGSATAIWIVSRTGG
jgi:hypothetical protein